MFKPRLWPLFLFIALLIPLTHPLHAQESAPEPQFAFQMCPWGLLITDSTTADLTRYLSITSPADYSGVVGSSFVVSGQGAGLFENNVVVLVTDSMGSVLFEQPTTMTSAEVGGAGAWSIDVALGELSGVTPITVTAYSTSAQDGSIVAQDTLTLNAGSEFGLPFVEITQPLAGQSVDSSSLRVEGMAGGIFENNLIIHILDSVGGSILAETFATVQTDAIGGAGPFAADIPILLDPGTSIVIHAFQPPVEDNSIITAEDIHAAVILPLALGYERLLILAAADPILQSPTVCDTARAEFDNTQIAPITVAGLQAISTMSMRPLVQLTVQAAKPSLCSAPARTRVVRSGAHFDATIYFSTASGESVCTRDLRPFTQQIPLGTLDSPDFTVTVNGVAPS